MCRCKFFKGTDNGKFPSILCENDEIKKEHQFLIIKGREKYIADVCCKNKEKCLIYKEIMGYEKVK